MFVWWRARDRRLSQIASEAIANADQVFVSIASAWEAAIKISLGKMRLAEPFEAGIEASEFEKLPIAFSHITGITTLPHHHGDPFDRMLIAQAQVEGLTVVTSDRYFEPYGIKIVWT